MNNKEFLTNWLIKFGTDWVMGADVWSQMRAYEVDYLFDLLAKGVYFDEQRLHTNTSHKYPNPMMFRLTQKALDYINEH